jgi:hypothetical protein
LDRLANSDRCFICETNGHWHQDCVRRR